MVLTCWMASSFRFGAGLGLLSLWPCATGTLPVIVQSPECCWTNVYLASTLPRKRFEVHAPKRALDGSHRCANGLPNTVDPFLEATRKNARRSRAYSAQRR